MEPFVTLEEMDSWDCLLEWNLNEFELDNIEPDFE